MADKGKPKSCPPPKCEIVGGDCMPCPFIGKPGTSIQADSDPFEEMPLEWLYKGITKAPAPICPPACAKARI